MTFTSGATTVTISGALYPYSLRHERRQNIGVAEDGSVKVYDRGVTEKFIAITFRDKETNLANIRNFITTTVVFAKNTFTFTPDSDVDAGAGVGVAVTVRYWGGKLLEKLTAFDRYEYDMILRVE